MTDEGAKSRQQGLQQAASVIFALVAVVPLLIFAWTLHALGAIRSTQAQLSLGLALAVALLGFWMFRSLLGRMAEVVRVLDGRHRAGHTRASRPGAAAGPPSPAPSRRGRGRRPRPACPPCRPPCWQNGRGRRRRGTGAAPPVAARRGARRPRSAAAAARRRRHRQDPRADRGRAHDGCAVASRGHAHLDIACRSRSRTSREPLIGTLTEATGRRADPRAAGRPDRVAYGRVTAIDRLTG